MDNALSYPSNAPGSTSGAAEYSDEGMRRCVINIAVSSADNLWFLEECGEKSKACVSIQFQGTDEACLFESEPMPPVLADPATASVSAFPANGVSASDGLDAATKDKEKGGPKGKVISKGKTKDENKVKHIVASDSLKAERDGLEKRGGHGEFNNNGAQQNIACFALGVVKEYVIISDWKLWHCVLNDPLVITVYRISQNMPCKIAVGRATIDISGLLHLQEGFIELPYPLAAVKPPPTTTLDDPKKSSAKLKDNKGGGKAGSDLGKKDGKDASGPREHSLQGKNGITAELVPDIGPALLPGATVKVKVSLSEPLLSAIDQEEGIVMDICNLTVTPVPTKLLELKEKVNGDPCAYTVAYCLPGYCGAWWNSIAKDLKLEELKSYSIAKDARGLTTTEDVLSSSITLPTDALNMDRGCSSAGPLLADTAEKPEIFAISATTSNDAHISGKADGLTAYEGIAQDDLVADIGASKRGSIVWSGSLKRFLPSVGVTELKKRVKKGYKFYGEIARYINEERKDLFDPCFDKYHSSFWLDLAPFLEEDITEANIVCPLECYYSRKTPAFPFDHLIPAEIPPGTKVTALEEDDVVDQLLDETTNPWKLCNSMLSLQVKLSKPLEPVWVIPPEPKLRLEDVFPPKLIPNIPFDDEMKASKEFEDLVRKAVTKISFLNKKLDGENTGDFINKAKYQEDIKKEVICELCKCGNWQNFEEDTKQKVLKIASEKVKSNKEKAPQQENHEFWIELYEQIIELTDKFLTKLFHERVGVRINATGNLEQVERVYLHSIEYLQQLAHEYEAHGDFESARRCYQECTSREGEEGNPNPWFDYGAFCMRGKMRDHKMAEDCFRKAIALKEDHVPSLLAMGCLLWHEKAISQAESIFRRCAELHFEDEFICWILLSQIFAVQRERKHVSSSLRRAEVLYKASIASINQCGASCMLGRDTFNGPFCLSRFVSISRDLISPSLNAALLLLNLHLPVEAQQILALEDDTICRVEKKWCHARVHELLEDYVKAEAMLDEALSLEFTDMRSWLLMGHVRHASGQYQEAIKAYKNALRYEADKQLDMFAFIEFGDCYLQLGDYCNAQQIFLKGCSLRPCSSLWLGAGLAFYQLGDMEQAEAALVEGNLLDVQNVKIWGYLTLVCLAMNRVEKAEVAFQQGMKHNINEPLLAEVGGIFCKKEMFQVDVL
ncbi:hypothetical protein O6H91_12G024300 [Diphasiastrum complanatum]|uniref:Uncharacterized protein n=1 Tax=Diphasiastrum complanatum TaxID=34168 RepID=A0ACC2BZN5_DIPCM|nr:hypothetical protein O6H91_12G024300 [Diphasiastrum complanatum]